MIQLYDTELHKELFMSLLWSKKKLKEIPYKEVETYSPKSNTILWGYAPVSPIHIGYDKIFYFLKTLSKKYDLKLHILAADIPTLLSHGLSLKQIHVRSNYYTKYLSYHWKLNAEFSKSSDYFYSAEYQLLLLNVIAKLKECKVRDSWNQDLKELKLVYQYVYPVIQVLDILHFKPAIVFSEASQYKIYKLLPEILSILDTDLPDTLFVFMKQSKDIRGRSLALSTHKDRITIHENKQSLIEKIGKMANLQNKESNPLDEFISYSIFPFFDKQQDFSINTVTCCSLQEIHNAVNEGKINLPQDKDEIIMRYLEIIQYINKEVFTSSNDTDWINFNKVRNIIDYEKD